MAAATTLSAHAAAPGDQPLMRRIPASGEEIPVIGLVGFITAGAIGFVLLISILRHGRL